MHVLDVDKLFTIQDLIDSVRMEIDDYMSDVKIMRENDNHILSAYNTLMHYHILGDITLSYVVLLD